MITRPIAKVTIEFVDGDTMTVDVPESQGFYRERYTYNQDENHRATNKLFIYEIHWTKVGPLNEHAPS